MNKILYFAVTVITVILINIVLILIRGDMEIGGEHFIVLGLIFWLYVHCAQEDTDEKK